MKFVNDFGGKGGQGQVGWKMTRKSFATSCTTSASARKKIAAELRAACAAGQAADAGALAHKLKSSSRAVGALVLGELCFEMEQAGKVGDMKALAGVEGFLDGYAIN